MILQLIRQKRSLTYLLLLIALLPNLVCASESKGEKDNWEWPRAVLVGEGLIALNAWMASEAPAVYGGLGVLLFPFAGGEHSSSELTYWTGLVAAESLAIYNISIDGDGKSKSEIFKDNMVGWHLFVLAVGVSSYIDSKLDKNENIIIEPEKDGMTLTYEYAF